MMFQFQVDLTPQIYVDFNTFIMTKTEYGKKQIRKFRVLFSVLVALLLALSIFNGGFSAVSLLSCMPMVLVWALFMWLFPRMMVSAIKATVKGMGKNGKVGYDPHAEMVFYEDHFEEIVPDKRTTQAYTTIERVSIERDKGVYLHMDNLRAYIVPVTAFDSPQQLEQFIEFLKSKIGQVDVYGTVAAYE